MPAGASLGAAIIGIFYDRIIHAGGNQQRVAGKFVALSARTKLAVRNAGTVMLAASIAAYGLDKVCRILNIRIEADLLDSVSASTTSLTLSAMNLTDVFNESIQGGIDTEREIVQVDSGPDGAQLYPEYLRAKASLATLKSWHAQMSPRWQALGNLCDKLTETLNELGEDLLPKP